MYVRKYCCTFFICVYENYRTDSLNCGSGFLTRSIKYSQPPDKVIISTYIRYWPLQPFSQAGPTVLRRLKTTDFWETFSWQFYLLSEFLPEICWEEIAEDNFLLNLIFNIIRTTFSQNLHIYISMKVGCTVYCHCGCWGVRLWRSKLHYKNSIRAAIR